MNIREQAQKRPTERMSNTGIRLMSLTFDLVDLVHPYIDRRVTTFGIREGMTAVDYGCGLSAKLHSMMSGLPGTFVWRKALANRSEHRWFERVRDGGRRS